MYHDQLGMAIHGGYAVGAAGQVPFAEPETAAVAFGLERQDTPAVLTFFCESCCLASSLARLAPHALFAADGRPRCCLADQTRTC